MQDGGYELPRISSPHSSRGAVVELTGDERISPRRPEPGRSAREHGGFASYRAPERARDFA